MLPKSVADMLAVTPSGFVRNLCYALKQDYPEGANDIIRGFERLFPGGRDNDVVCTTRLRTTIVRIWPSGETTSNLIDYPASLPGFHLEKVRAAALNLHGRDPGTGALILPIEVLFV